MVEAGSVPGYPQHDGLDFFDITAEEWSLFVMEFRNAALQFYAQIDRYAAHIRSMNLELIYNTYIPGAWVFYASPRKYPQIF
jgi:cytochrome b subunit of formate dehydrogenase